MSKKSTSGKEGLTIAEIPLAGEVTAHFITVQMTEADMPKVFEQIAAEVRKRNAQIAFQFFFGGRRFYPQIVSAMPQLDWPLTLLQGDACSGEDITGTQVIAISGAPLHPILDGERKAGCWVETSDARYCLLGDLRADDLSQSREEQAYAVFEKMELLLKQADMLFTDVARTWIYLNELLTWYDEFNAVRTRFFSERGVFGKMVPASTGIGAGSAAGEMMVGALLAIKPKHEKMKICAVPSPLQCPALDYKSSFARAVEIKQAESRLLMISGTASIDPNGATAHIGDTKQQIALTMDVVHEILKSRGMDWMDVIRGIAYFKDIREVHLLQEYCDQEHIPPLPIVVSHADICRHDLLFEIELDAVNGRFCGGPFL